jgi:hypothetical protein
MTQFRHCVQHALCQQPAGLVCLMGGESASDALASCSHMSFLRKWCEAGRRAAHCSTGASTYLFGSLLVMGKPTRSPSWI